MKVERKYLKIVRSALIDAMKAIAKEHICDDCITSREGNHETHCKYVRAVLLINARL